jgi:hypothetical protein
MSSPVLVLETASSTRMSLACCTLCLPRAGWHLGAYGRIQSDKPQTHSIDLAAAEGPMSHDRYSTYTKYPIKGSGNFGKERVVEGRCILCIGVWEGDATSLLKD